MVYIHLRAWQTRTDRNSVLYYIIFYANIAVQNVNKEFVYIMDFTASLKIELGRYDGYFIFGPLNWASA